MRRCVMFLRYFHEIVPLRFLEERCNSEIEQLLKNHEMLKPETEANALARRAWSELLLLLHVDDDSDRERSDKRSKSLNMVEREIVGERER